MSLLRTTLSLIAVSTLLAGCKLAVISGEGGDVQSLSGSRDCPDTSYCVFELADASFSESFTAIPKAGYEFVQWQEGTYFQCANSSNPICTVSLSGGLGAMAIVASYQVGFLMPLYKDVGIDSDGDGLVDRLDEDDDNDGLLDVNDPCPLDPNLGCTAGIPITDTITVGGIEWAQVDLFTNLTWEDLNAVCPQGPCANFGQLNGYDMTGWMWATRSEMNVLFNHYLNPSQQIPEDNIALISEAEAVAFFADGWRPTTEFSPSKTIAAYTNEANATTVILDQGSFSIGLNAIVMGSQLGSNSGGWFYHSP